MMTLAEARRIAGSLGFPSKMPGTSYALPAAACIAGARLARIPDSICSACYALGGKASYQMPRAAIGQQRRLVGIGDPRWVPAMVRLLTAAHSRPIKVDLGLVGIRRQKQGGSRYRWNEPGYHRWHDSGDLQSVEHLEKIIEVCELTPQIRHWLPTRELAMLRLCTTPIPENLVIRVSATMIEGKPPGGFLAGSTVHRDTPPAGAHCCPAPRQDRECKTCRACWSRDVSLVSYELH